MKFSNFFVLSLFALNIACTGSDDEYRQPIVSSFEVADLISIPDASATYSLNDTLYVELNVPAASLTSKTGETIDLAELVPNSSFVEFYLFRYAKTDTDRANSIPFTENDVFLVKGIEKLIKNPNGLLVRGLKDSGVYKARIGIKLKTAGEFYLSPLKQSNTDSFYAYLQDSRTSDIVELKTSIKNQTPSNRFSFEVTEE